MLAHFTAPQATLLFLAQRLFIVNQLLNFPLYYIPGIRGLLGGDGEDAKFPCSISWMTRKGVARLSTLAYWNVGWYFMLAAFARDGGWMPFLFMLQMYSTGFVTVVLTPMMGADVAMGAADALHCYSAMIYVFDHFVANEFVLGVSLRSPYGWGFALSSAVCGVFQALRADDDALAKRLHSKSGLAASVWPPLKRVLEYGFMLTENALFFIFLIGMTSGITIAGGQPAPLAKVLTPMDGAVAVGIVAAVCVLEVRCARTAAITAPPVEAAPNRASTSISKRRQARSPAKVSQPAPAPPRVRSRSFTRKPSPSASRRGAK